MTPAFFAALAVAIALGAACSALSVFVVTKRWAFIGEGIAHAGFGGAGTAWMLALIFPSATFLTNPTSVYAISLLFCLGVATLVAMFTRRGRTTVDTVIGIFLVGSLAWGFLAYGLYSRQTGHMPPQFGEYLGFEPLRGLSGPFVAMAIAVSAAVLTAIALAWKELLFYATDEHQAEASGVNVRLIHYGLILLLAMVIMVGMRLMGTVLVVALLVLPGATGLLIGKSTRSVWTASLITGILGAASGPLINLRFAFVPEGPAIVLVLFLAFILTLAVTRLKPSLARSR